MTELIENIDSLKSRIVELENELSQLKYSEEILRKAEIAAGTGSWQLDLDKGKMYSSDGALRLYGLKGNILDYSVVREIPLPEYRPILDKALRNLIDNGTPYDVTFKIKNAETGRIIDIHSICEIDSEKRILRGTIQDITNQTKEEEYQERNRLDLSTLLRITFTLLESPEKRKVLQKIVDGAVRLIGLDSGALYSLKDDNLYLEASFPLIPKDFPEEFRKAILKNHNHIREAVISRNPVLVRDIETEPLSPEENIIIKNRNMHSILYIPLMVMQKVSGVLILGTIGRTYDFTSREIDLCHTVSNIGSLALENSLLFEQLSNNVQELKSTIRIKEITEEKLRLLKRAVDQSPVSIIITNQKGIIEYVNPKFSKITGFTSEEAIGQSPGILKSGHHSDLFYKELWDRINSGNDWYGEMMNKKKSGEFYWENVLISPMTDENSAITHFVGIKEDITEKKAMIGNLITAKEKAEENDRLKTAFLHNISHEIRTPLNAIVGFSTFLKDKNLTDEQRETYSNIIISSNDHLLSVIDGIMKISHIEAGQVSINKTEADVSKIINILYNQFKPQAIKKNLAFILDDKIEKGTMLVTDEGKLRQILVNLLENAMKFTDKGYIEMGCRMNEKFIEFIIEDTGIGVPEEEQEKIFERFYQAKKSNSRIYSGAGLGLSISSGYAELLGGRLTVKSTPGKGSVFTLSIPMNLS
jgi:PAS domain S-box-containing protein